MSLMSIIQRNMAGAGQPTGTTDETMRAKRLMQAQSGKAVGADPTATSNVAEQVAGADANEKLANVRQKATTLAMQLGEGIEQQKRREALMQTDIDLSKQAQDQGLAQRLGDLNQKASQDAETLDLQKAQAGAEQRAMQRAFQNKAYLDELKRFGDRTRLDSELEFRRQLTRNAVGNNEELLRKMLGNKEILAADDREFQRMVAAIDLDTARQLANNAMTDAKAAGWFSAAGGAAAAGVGYYGKPKPAPTTTSTVRDTPLPTGRQ